MGAVASKVCRSHLGWIQTGLKYGPQVERGINVAVDHPTAVGAVPKGILVAGPSPGVSLLVPASKPPQSVEGDASPAWGGQPTIGVIGGDTMRALLRGEVLVQQQDPRGPHSGGIDPFSQRLLRQNGPPQTAEGSAGVPPDVRRGGLGGQVAHPYGHGRMPLVAPPAEPPQLGVDKGLVAVPSDPPLPSTQVGAAGLAREASDGPLNYESVQKNAVPDVLL